MSRYRVRHFAGAIALLALPAFTCGVGPVVWDLIQRVDMLEADADAQPVVVDANGVQVGTVSALNRGNEGVTVAIKFEDFPLFLAEVRTSTLLSEGLQLFLASDDCSGTEAFLSARTNVLSIPWLDQTMPGSPVYVEDRSVEPELHMFQSILRENGDCEVRPEPANTFGVPAIPGPNWRDEFTPPFKVVTRAEFLAMQQEGN